MKGVVFRELRNGLLGRNEKEAKRMGRDYNGTEGRGNCMGRDKKLSKENEARL